nr:lysophospholipid acyltransferase family protein [Helcobacillus massiliensis]
MSAIGPPGVGRRRTAPVSAVGADGCALSACPATLTHAQRKPRIPGAPSRPCGRTVERSPLPHAAKDARPVFYENARRLLVPVVRLLWRPRIAGLENVPTSGPVLLASNHLANIDSLVIAVIATRKVRFIIKDEYWKRTGLKARIQQRFFESIGSVPVDRGTLKSARGSLEAALEVLTGGDVFAIYPEGTRSKDGLLGKGKQGAAWLAQMSGAPVVPVGLKGTEKLWNKGQILPRLHRFSVSFGAPIDFSDLEEIPSEAARRRAMTERIMDEIQALSGQERR